MRYISQSLKYHNVILFPKLCSLTCVYVCTDSVNNIHISLIYRGWAIMWNDTFEHFLLQQSSSLVACGVGRLEVCVWAEWMGVIAALWGLVCTVLWATLKLGGYSTPLWHNHLVPHSNKIFIFILYRWNNMLEKHNVDCPCMPSLTKK